MAREKMFDPAFQKSFTEAIHKENKIRVKWHLEHGARLKRGVSSCGWDDEPDDDDDDFVAGDEKGDRYSSPQEAEEDSKAAKVQKLLDIKSVERKTRPHNIMKPVPVETKRLLYKGLSHNGEGKSNYLRSRYKDDPEDKFYFPICSSWEYGWTFGQTYDLPNPEHGRREIMKMSFFRPNDPQLKPRD